MANPIKGEVIIEIGGKKHPLVFSFDAIAIIENHFDESVLDVQETKLARSEPRLFILETILDAGAKGEYEGAELSGENLPPIKDIISKIRQALHVAYFGISEPEQEPEDEKKPDPQKS